MKLRVFTLLHSGRESFKPGRITVKTPSVPVHTGTESMKQVDLVKSNPLPAMTCFRGFKHPDPQLQNANIVH